MTTFQLHPQLLAECHQLGRLSHCQLLLHKNAAVLWFILVPDTEITDLLELPPEEAQAVLEECRQVARYIKQQAGYAKINFGAIGNLVPQLHLHVIGRRPEDPCWPQPVWGHLKAQEGYADRDIAAIKTAVLEVGE
ncbi:hypothetical protein XM38_048490 [Halomicronema hongdechloris C2206]|uniref:HIT domain-containing protein n=1 Tax=Halomicronema hongdechloris C2206 TaxID=1641165 RepID=A0A1Z3HUD0_9CYAN|nr:HIT family protein [Halomicronema hongdechloris]ASC73875.1 hypothetical protein XM38_048490 [Halomicronema hongdechloris C2206]